MTFRSQMENNMKTIYKAVLLGGFLMTMGMPAFAAHTATAPSVAPNANNTHKFCPPPPPVAVSAGCRAVVKGYSNGCPIWGETCSATLPPPPR